METDENEKKNGWLEFLGTVLNEYLRKSIISDKW